MGSCSPRGRSVVYMVRRAKQPGEQRTLSWGGGVKQGRALISPNTPLGSQRPLPQNSLHLQQIRSFLAPRAGPMHMDPRVQP